MAHKIVIIDDDTFIRELLEQTLEELQDEGVQILTAHNGEVGLRLIEREAPDLVFLDVMMPRLNGFEVCHAIKHELGLLDTHVIMLTSKGQALDREKGQKAGANDYPTKPFNPDEIINLARRVLSV